MRRQQETGEEGLPQGLREAAHGSPVEGPGLVLPFAEKPEKFAGNSLDLAHLLPLPLLGTVVYRDSSLNSCPCGLALAPAPGLRLGRHPDRLQMSVGVELHQALVLRAGRRRIRCILPRSFSSSRRRVSGKEEDASCLPPLWKGSDYSRRASRLTSLCSEQTLLYLF